MKKTTCRMLCMTLALVMLFGLATVGSATTVQWTDGGTNYVLTVTFTATTTQKFVIANAPTYTHSGTGTTNVSYAGSYTKNVSCVYTGSFSDYKNYIDQAVLKDGNNDGDVNRKLFLTYTYSGTINTVHTLDSGDAAGEYKVAVVFKGEKGTWSVRNDIVLGSIGAEIQAETNAFASGLISFVPTGETVLTAQKIG